MEDSEDASSSDGENRTGLPVVLRLAFLFDWLRGDGLIVSICSFVVVIARAFQGLQQ